MHSKTNFLDVVPPDTPSRRRRRVHRPLDGVPVRRQRNVGIPTSTGLCQKGRQTIAPRGGHYRQPACHENPKKRRFRLRSAIHIRKTFTGFGENAQRPQAAEVPRDHKTGSGDTGNKTGHFEAERRSAVLSQLDDSRGHGVVEGHTDVPGVAVEFDDHFAGAYAQLGFRRGLCEYGFDYVSVGQAV